MPESGVPRMGPIPLLLFGVRLANPVTPWVVLALLAAGWLAAAWLLPSEPAE